MKLKKGKGKYATILVIMCCLSGEIELRCTRLYMEIRRKRFKDRLEV